LNLPLTNSFVTWAGWLVPYDTDVYLLLGEGAESRLVELVRALGLIGLDRITGYFTHTALKRGGELQRIPQLQPSELASLPRDRKPTIIDVRHDNEWLSGHLPDAIHVPLGHLSEHLADLPKGRPLITQCRSGGRSAIAASLLRRAGFSDVSNLVGGIEAWQKAGLPVVSDR
jgi:hydroxyacylglutathione hydrolase